MSTVECQSLLEVWFKLMGKSGLGDEGVKRMREAYQRDVAVLPPREVRDMMVRGGFESPVLFFQTGLIHAWYAKRVSSGAKL